MARTRTNTPSRGAEMETQLRDAIRELGQVPHDEARPLPFLTGLRANGSLQEPLDNVLLRALDLLIASQRVFLFGSSIVLEIERIDGDGRGLVTLCTGTDVAVGAEDLLSNVILCGTSEQQFTLPKSICDVLLRSELAWRRLPRIQTYAARPVFDADFVLRGPGWHAGPGILVHGPAIDPWLPPALAAGDSAYDLLPPHLRQLLAGFCFATDADLINAVGLLLTGLLANHFVPIGKAVAIVDGNQPNLGKTLLIRVLGLLLDGIEPLPTAFNADDDELQKRICATLRSSPQSVLLLDNAKVRTGTEVNSPTIEALSTAPEIVLRILGRSENFRRPNDLIWAITMNNAKASRDLVTRGLAIRLAFDGDPAERSFTGPEPLAYARTHRFKILAELAGMVVRWVQNGKPRSRHSHRLWQWAQLIGGILETAGLPGFLSNATAAAIAFNKDLERLSALAEAAIRHQGPVQFLNSWTDAQNAPPGEGRSAGAWAPLFQQAGVMMDGLDGCESQHSKAIYLGRFLSPMLGRRVPFEVRDRAGTAELCAYQGRSATRLYFFRIVWGDSAIAAAQHSTSPGVCSTAPATRPEVVPAAPPQVAGNLEAWS